MEKEKTVVLVVASIVLVGIIITVFFYVTFNNDNKIKDNEVEDIGQIENKESAEQIEVERKNSNNSSDEEDGEDKEEEPLQRLVKEISDDSAYNKDSTTTTSSGNKRGNKSSKSSGFKIKNESVRSSHGDRNLDLISTVEEESIKNDPKKKGKDKIQTFQPNMEEPSFQPLDNEEQEIVDENFHSQAADKILDEESCPSKLPHLRVLHDKNDDDFQKIFGPMFLRKLNLLYEKYKDHIFLIPYDSLMGILVTPPSQANNIIKCEFSSVKDFYYDLVKVAYLIKLMKSKSMKELKPKRRKMLVYLLTKNPPPEYKEAIEKFLNYLPNPYKPFLDFVRQNKKIELGQMTSPVRQLLFKASSVEDFQAPADLLPIVSMLYKNSQIYKRVVDFYEDKVAEITDEIIEDIKVITANPKYFGISKKMLEDLKQFI